MWALGAVLYELLTGRPPFRGSTVLDTLEQVRARDPVPVRQLQPKVPADLETICLKCLEKEPARRYAVGRRPGRRPAAVPGRASRSRPGRSGTCERAWRWCRREPRTAGLVAATRPVGRHHPGPAGRVRAAADAGRGAGGGGAEGDATRPRGPSGRPTRRPRRTGTTRPSTRPPGCGPSPGPGWRDEAVRQALAAAAADTPDRDPVAVRTELAAALGAIDLQRIDRWPTASRRGALAFAPNGRLAVAPQLSQPFIGVRFVALVDPGREGRAEAPVPPVRSARMVVDATTALAFSPNGRWLFLGLRSGTVFRWDLDAPPKTARVAFEPPSGPVAAFAFSPDSQWVYTAGHDGQVKRWPIDGPDEAPAATWPANRERPEGRHRTGLAYWTGSRPGVLAFGPAGAALLDPMTLRPTGPGGRTGSPRPSTGRPARSWPTRRAGRLVVQRETDLDVVYWERGHLPAGRPAPRPAAGERAGPRRPDRGHGPPPVRAAAGDRLPERRAGEVVGPGDRGTGLRPCRPPAGGRWRSAPTAAPWPSAGTTRPPGTSWAGCGSRPTSAAAGCRSRRSGGRPPGTSATIAAVEHPDKPQHARTVASVWGPDGDAAGDRPAPGRGPARERALPGGGLAGERRRTAFHAGDGALTWWDPAGRPEAGRGRTSGGDLLRPEPRPGRAGLVARRAGTGWGCGSRRRGGPAKVIACGSLAGRAAGRGVRPGRGRAGRRRVRRRVLAGGAGGRRDGARNVRASWTRRTRG